MDAADRDLFERSVRSCLERCGGSVPEQALLDLGWDDALGTDPRTAVEVLLALQGYLNVTSPLDMVLAPVLCPAHPERPVVLPPFGSDRAPAVRRRGRIVVHGIGTSRLPDAELATVAVATEPGAAVEAGDGPLMVDVRVDRMELRPVGGLDPSLGLVTVDGTVDEPPGWTAPSSSAGGTAAGAAAATNDAAPVGAWESGVARARMALAHELTGAARRMLELARDHATERVQFGRPIASFQAVRHRLADCLVTVESAEAAVVAAWEEGTPFGAAVAKAVAGKSAQVVARHAQQVLAGMGFTAEHPLHRFVKRTIALDLLFGSADSITRQLGAELIGARSLPPALPL